MRFTEIKKFILAFILFLAALINSAGAQMVTSCGGHFWLNGKQWNFVGANLDVLPFLSHPEIDCTFTYASQLGIKVIRLWLSRGRTTAVLANLDNVDYMLNSARAYNMWLIMTFVDYRWCIWLANQREIPERKFFTSAGCKNDYKNWLSTVINRVNRLNGIAYKEEEHILSWELCNEPECCGAASLEELCGWIEEMSTYVRSLDENHMISVGTGGGTGWYLHPQGSNPFIAMHESENLSFCTFHFYKFYEIGEEMTRNLLSFIVDDAHSLLEKPVVMEEYGYSIRNAGGNKKTKENWYKFLLDTFYDLKGDGTAFWRFYPRSNLTEDELERANGISMHPDDAELREIIARKAEEISTQVEEDGEKASVPQRFHLFQNYPNPFNSQTNISYQLPARANITLKIYDALGQEVRTLVNQYQSAGHHSVVWDGKNKLGESVGSGIYFYQLKMDNPDLSGQTKKLLFLK